MALLCDNLNCPFVFSNAFLAFTTPVCKSARTLVVPPGEIYDNWEMQGVGGWMRMRTGNHQFQ